MARKIEKVDASVLENIVAESFKRLGIEANEEQIKLVFRLIISGIAYHFFVSPDTEVEVGFTKFNKSPNLDDLFTVEIIRNADIYNAKALYKYYRAEYTNEQRIKNIVEEFVDDLLVYSQQQDFEINGLTNSLKTQNKAKRRK